MTPRDKLRSLDKAERFLKPGATFGPLDTIAHAVSDLRSKRTSREQAKGEMTSEYQSAVCTARGLLCGWNARRLAAINRDAPEGA